MKTKLLLTTLLSFVFCLLSSQIPQGFNYQAIARNTSGDPITNTLLPVRITIQSDSLGGTTYWIEEHSTVTTNSFGLFTLIVGKGVKKAGSTAATFNDIDWTKTPKFIKTEIYSGVWKNMGSSRLWTIPYSMIAGDLNGPVKKLGVKGNTTDPDSVLFEVKNSTGQTIFAVYNEGVRIYVDDGKAKGSKGGFAVGGFGSTTKGGGVSQNLLTVTSDSIRMYINDLPGKGAKGGFAVGGFDKTKGGNVNFMNVATDAGGIINPSQNRVLWYPIKNAFLVGKVLIEKPDSVGINSFASGYESKAKGMYSQAMGYKAIAGKDYSTAIGKNSVAKGISSFAFGNLSVARGDDSYAFGTGAQATGNLSFALGSVGVDTSNVPTGKTIASGMGAFALGFGSVASSQGAFTFGVVDSASGPFSLAMGYATRSRGVLSTTMGAGTIVEAAGWCATATGVFTKAGNWASAAFGDQSYAKGHTSFAAGFKTTAGGQLSTTFGDQTTANGYASMAMGFNTTAQAYGSLVIGKYNTISGTTGTWNSWEPVFVIGNGTSTSARSNAMTVYKSGAADFGSYVNLNRNSTGGALYANNDEALWYNGTYFSWGYGGSYNYFAKNVTIGNAANPGYSLYVQGSVYALGGWAGSDIRWKKNLQPVDNDIEGLLRLQGYKYNWRKDEFPEMNFEDETQIGLIAQDVEKVFPELVRTDDKGYKAVSYEKLSVLLLEGIKEQQAQIDSQNKKILRLEKLVDQLITEKGPR